MMTQPQAAPYGSWKCLISADLISTEGLRIIEAVVDGEDIYWIEMRPTENGRYVIVRRTPDGKTIDVTPPTFSARTRVHEYGGAALVVSEGVVYFSNFADQRLYRQLPGSEPQPITPDADLRYADGVIDSERNRLICVREDHTDTENEAVNTLVGIPLDGRDNGQILVCGNDFYSSPRLSPDGTRLAWLTWNHPNMPWDGVELWVGEISADGSLTGAERVAGDVDESIFQPEWSPDGALYFVSDRTDWWNLYCYQAGTVEPICEMEAEFGRPQWIFGMSTYKFVSANQIVCTYTQNGIWHLGSLDTVTHSLEPIETPYTSITNLQTVPGGVLFNAVSSTESASIVRLDLATRELEVVCRSSEIDIDPGYFSIPQAIEFPTDDNLTAHAFFCPPRNRDYTPPADNLPPLLVISHGGPTSATSTALDLEIQYWTSRGIAVLDVNYGGSSGYGRAYRQRLNGQWGVVDVNDCVNGALYLAEQGYVDGNRLAIRGGSAGGYTTLSALTFRDVFKAGASYYGISDLEAMTRDTHKFESRYLDSLIGPYPEKQDRYRERSPIHFTDRLSCPLILFQGLEDKVVPPNQAEMMVEALRVKGLPVAYVPFEGEQHGFRRSENIRRSLEAELYFYGQVFGFAPADAVEPVEIDNLT
jgi:dipeptidyl aminopeptidase/acylaminoacyl peptidase